MLNNLKISQDTASNILNSCVLDAVSTTPINYQDYNITSHNSLILITTTPCININFLTQAIADSLNLTQYHFYNCNNAEHNLLLFNLYIANEIGAISSANMACGVTNSQLISLFKIKTVVLIQDLYNSMIHLTNNIINNNIPHFLWVNKNFKNFTYDQVLEYIITYALPWYIKFYTSWQTQCKNSSDLIFWLKYEDLYNNSNINNELKSFINTNKLLLNLPEKPKDNDLILPNKYKEHISNLITKYYPEYDFSKLGL